MFRSLLTFTFSIIFICYCNAQVKIGNESSHTVNPSALLELSNNLSEPPCNWKTFLPPQVDFTNPVFTVSTVWGIAGNPVTGAIVFNLGNNYTNGFTGQGLYCWIGNRWVQIGCPPPPAAEDKLRQALSTSIPAYDTTADNSWLMITESEYQNVLSVINSAGRYAANDSFMNLPSEIGWNQLYTVGGNLSGSLVPPASYIIAWSVRTGVYFPSSSHHSKIKTSSSRLTGYSDYGPSLPDYALSPDTRYYFLLKKPVSTTGPAPSYTGVYAFHAKFLGGRLDSAGEYFTPGDSPVLNNTYLSRSAVQFMCTQVRQW